MKIGQLPTNNLCQRPLSNDQIVMGYDEVEQKWIKVQYRADSNRFFDYPYTGTVYPYYRMNKYKQP